MKSAKVLKSLLVLGLICSTSNVVVHAEETTSIPMAQVEESETLVENGEVTVEETVNIEEINESIDISWYHEDQNEFVLTTVEELFGLSKLVNEGNSFSNKTIKLGNNIDLKNQEWIPIGSQNNQFKGNFDGQSYFISNLKINTPTKSDVGFFGYTSSGQIKNFTLQNVDVIGYLDVGAVAGTPYTAKYSDINVTGLIQINGYAYVGGAFGKNAYGNIINVDVNSENGSYVNADSENYRTYVGGLVGFMGEGNHIVSNCDVKIDVIGSTGDVGGILGILHYGNTLTDCTYEGNLKMNKPNVGSSDENEIGALVGVVQTGGDSKTKSIISNCTATVTSAILNGKDITNIITPHGDFYNDALGKIDVSISATVNGKEWYVKNKPVFIGNEYYDSLSEAVIAANENDIINLQNNLILTENLIIDKPIILDLNNKTITGSFSSSSIASQDNLINITSDGVVIKNGTLDSISGVRNILHVFNSNNVILQNMILDHTNSYSGAPLIINSSNAIVKERIEFIMGNNSWYAFNVDAKNGDASIDFEKLSKENILMNGDEKLSYGYLENNGQALGQYVNVEGNKVTFKELPKPIDPTPDPSIPSYRPSTPDVEGSTTESGEKVEVDEVRTDSEVKETLGKENVITSVEVEKVDEPVEVTVNVGKKLKDETVYVVQQNPKTNELELVATSTVDKKGNVVFTTESTEKLTLTTALPEGFINTVATSEEESVTYYITEENEIKKGWLETEEGTWYYFNYETGAMYKNTWASDGQDAKGNPTWYFLNADGSMKANAWIWRDSESAYYVDANGKMVYGPTTVDGYAIDANGLWHK